MDRVLALHTLTGTSIGDMGVLGSDQSIDCSSATTKCSTQSFTCPITTQAEPW